MDDAALAALQRSIFDFACAQPVSAYVDVERVLPALDAAADPARMARWIERLHTPARRRLLDHFGASQTTLSAWLPAPLRDRLAELLARPAPLPRGLIDELVASETARTAFRELMREALSMGIRLAFEAPPGGGGGGLRGMVGRGARVAGSAGRSLLGGLGEGLQSQLEQRLLGVVDAVVAALQKRVAAELGSARTAARIGAERARGFAWLLARREAEVAASVAQLPHDLLEALVPMIVGHNLQRAELRALIASELAALLAGLGDKPLGEVLDDLGLRDLARAWWMDRAGLVRAFVDAGLRT